MKAAAMTMMSILRVEVVADIVVMVEEEVAVDIEVKEEIEAVVEIKTAMVFEEKEAEDVLIVMVEEEVDAKGHERAMNAVNESTSHENARPRTQMIYNHHSNQFFIAPLVAI